MVKCKKSALCFTIKLLKNSSSNTHDSKFSSGSLHAEPAPACLNKSILHRPDLNLRRANHRCTPVSNTWRSPIEPYSVFLLDDDEDLRPVLAELINSHCDCRILALESYQAMFERANAVLSTRIAFLDVNLGRGKPNGIDAYEWLLRNNYKGKILFLTGHAKNHPLVSKAMGLGNATVLCKPVPAMDLVNDVRQAIASF
ncbi:MAG: response regulator [Bdellovibrionales bacterium]